MKEFFDILSNVSLPGLLAAAVYIIYLLVSKKGPVKLISDNHLSGLPTMQKNMSDMGQTLALLLQAQQQSNTTLQRMEDTLRLINEGIGFLKGRL